MEENFKEQFQLNGLFFFVTINISVVVIMESFSFLSFFVRGTVLSGRPTEDDMTMW